MYFCVEGTYVSNRVNLSLHGRVGKPTACNNAAAAADHDADARADADEW